MTQWIKTDGSIVDTAKGEGITAAGTYLLNRATMDRNRPFVFGAVAKTAGHTASVQLFADVVGVRTNLGSALVPTFGFPAAGADEYTLTGERGIVVSAISGAVFPEALQ